MVVAAITESRAGAEPSSGFALASADVADGDTRTIAFGAVILAYAVFRTLRPIRYEEGPGTVWGVLAELAL